MDVQKTEPGGDSSETSLNHAAEWVALSAATGLRLASARRLPIRSFKP
jgi:hypothetical protein